MDGITIIIFTVANIHFRRGINKSQSNLAGDVESL